MAFNGYLIAEAYATLAIDDRQFNSKLIQAGRQWDALGKKIGMTRVTGFNAMAKSVANFGAAAQGAVKPVTNLSKAMSGLAKSAAAVNRAMGPGSAAMKASKWGSILGIFGALGGGIKSAFKGIGVGLGMFGLLRSTMNASAKSLSDITRAVRGLTRAVAAMGKAFSASFSPTAIAAMKAMAGIMNAHANAIKARSVANLNNAKAASIAALTAIKVANMKAGGKVDRIGKFNSDIERAKAIALKADAQARATIMRVGMLPTQSFGSKFYNSVTSPFRTIGRLVNTALAPFRALRSIISTATAPLRAVFSLKNIAVGLAGATVAGFGAKEFVENAANMELSFARVRRAAEFTDDEFRTFRKDLLAFGNVTNGVKLENLFEIANVGAKIGISGDQLNLFTRDMAKVRIAISESDLPTEEMAERIGSLISVFHRGNDEAIKFASALNALDLKSVASAREILDVSGRMSGTASLLGMKPQEVLALSTALRQARVPIETAGTAMQQIMGRMASRKDSPQFARIAGMKEKPFLKLVGTDPLKAIIKIEEGLQRLDKITAIRALDQLGLDGQRVRGTLLQLGTVLPQLNDYVKVSNREWTTFASIAESVATIGETLWGHWEKVKTNFASLADAIGKGFLPILKELADAVSRLMQDMRESFERNKEVLGPWFRWMSEKVQMIGVVWRAWPSFVDLATHTIGEKLDQAAHVFTRFAALVSATMQELGRDIGDYFDDITDKIGSSIDNTFIKLNNAIPGMPKMAEHNVGTPVFGRGRLPVGQRAGDAAAKALGDQNVDKDGVRVQFARPGAGFNVFGGAMPNRDMQKKKAQGEIDAAIQDQKLDDWQARQEMRKKDEETRRQADMLRREGPPAEPRRRRGADLSVLRPGPTGVDFGANMARARILRRNVTIPNVAMPAAAPAGIGLRARDILPGLAGPPLAARPEIAAHMALQARRRRLALPIRLRDTEANPDFRGFMGPRREAIGEVGGQGLLRDARAFGEMPVADRTGGGDGVGRVGRRAQAANAQMRQGRAAANAQFREWRRRENLRMRGRVDLRDSGDGALRGPGIKVQDKEKGIEEVLTENKLQTKELIDIRTALNEIKARPAMTM